MRDREGVDPVREARSFLRESLRRQHLRSVSALTGDDFLRWLRAPDMPQIHDRNSTTAPQSTSGITGTEDLSWGAAEANILRPHRGRFVALTGTEVVTTGNSLSEVFGWLKGHDRTAATVFRVPLDPTVDPGSFPE